MQTIKSRENLLTMQKVRIIYMPLNYILHSELQTCVYKKKTESPYQLLSCVHVLVTDSKTRLYGIQSISINYY